LDSAEFFNQRERPVGRDDLVKPFPVNKFHDDERLAILSADVEYDSNVRMQRSLRLAVKPLEHLRLSVQAFIQGLDGYGPADQRIFAAIDHAHPATSEDAKNLVLADLLTYTRVHGSRSKAPERAETDCLGLANEN